MVEKAARFFLRHYLGCVVLICVALTLCFMRCAKGDTYTVRTLDELKKSLATTQPSLTVQVVGTIKLDGTLTIPETLRDFRIVGDKQTSGLSFAKLPIDKPCNGVEINSYTAVFYGLTFSGFEPSGACVKFNGAGAATFAHCTFSDISTLYVRPTTQPVDATGVHYGHCLTSHGTSQLVNVSDCTFRRCCWSSAEYSHCLYMHVPNVNVTDCLFDQCGGGTMELYGESVLVAGNTAQNGISAPTRTGDRIAPAFAYIPQGTNAVYVRNTLKGDWRAKVFGWPDAGDLVQP